MNKISDLCELVEQISEPKDGIVSSTDNVGLKLVFGDDI